MTINGTLAQSIRNLQRAGIEDELPDILANFFSYEEIAELFSKAKLISISNYFNCLSSDISTRIILTRRRSTLVRNLSKKDNVRYRTTKLLSIYDYNHLYDKLDELPEGPLEKYPQIVLKILELIFDKSRNELSKYIDKNSEQIFYFSIEHNFAWDTGGYTVALIYPEKEHQKKARLEKAKRQKDKKAKKLEKAQEEFQKAQKEMEAKRKQIEKLKKQIG